MSQLIQFLGRLHPMVLHLPIGLLSGLIALELFAYLRRKPVAREVAMLMIWLAALSGVVAAASGFILSYEGNFIGSTLDWHLKLGLGFAAVSLLSAILLTRGSVGAYRGLLLVSAGLMVPVGHLGASMTHGESFLTAPFGSPIRPEEGVSVERIDSPPANRISDAVISGDFSQPREFFVKYCIECHGVERAKGRLRLDSVAALQKGGKSGPSFVAGKPGESLIINRVRRELDEDGHMPPEKRPQPTDAEIRVLETWIAEQSATQPAKPEIEADHIPEVVEESPVATRPTGPVIAPPSSAAIDALKQQLIHVEPIERGSNLMMVDFGAVAKTLTDESARSLILGIREQTASLSLARMAISDDTAAVIGTLPNLRALDLRSTPVGDRGVAALQESGIEELNLAQTHTTDAAIDVLSAMKSLKRVFLWKTELSPEGIGRLSVARPDLRIITGAETDADPVDSEQTLTYSSDAPIPGAAATPAGLKPTNSKCPVTGSPVDPRYSIVYDGRVIGFCCPNCPKEFWADPKKFEPKTE